MTAPASPTLGQAPADLPFTVVLDGRDVPLGPLDTALVCAVLAASHAMRHRRSFKILLHVKAGVVHAELTRHLREIPYPDD